jgi:hypothetical protein
MDQMAQDNEFRSALAAFETSVTSPVVSGDLVDWTEKVAKSWSEASTCIHFQLKHSHPRQFEEIANADAALLRQVELLRSEDEAIESEREKLSQTVSRIAQHIPKMEPDEAKAQPHIQALMDQAVTFVSRLRKQEVALQTWFAEAFNRERGGGD